MIINKKKKEKRKRRKKEKEQKALQLSGKIPALGAGGPGSIPGGAQFLIFIFIHKKFF